MSDTPRTDELLGKIGQPKDEPWDSGMAYFARELEREAARHRSIYDAAKDLHDYLWENVPDILDISTHSELAGEGVKKRLQALHDALKDTNSPLRRKSYEQCSSTNGRGK